MYYHQDLLELFFVVTMVIGVVVLCLFLARMFYALFYLVVHFFSDTLPEPRGYQRIKLLESEADPPPNEKS